MKDLNEYTREEFLALDTFGIDQDFAGVVIVPTGEVHDSGWGTMKFILTRGNEIVGAVGGWSDVLHINGIGGYGRDWKRTMETGMVPVVGWSIDCLAKSGCVRLFSNKKCNLRDRLVLSDFEIFTED